MRARYGPWSFACVGTLKQAVGVDTLEEGSSSLGYLKVDVLMSDVIEKI